MVYLAEGVRFGAWAYVGMPPWMFWRPCISRKTQLPATISFDGIPIQTWSAPWSLWTGHTGKCSCKSWRRSPPATRSIPGFSLNKRYFYQKDSYSPDDLASYKETTGRSDWPRRPGMGVIATGDPSIGNWRSTQLARLIN